MLSTGWRLGVGMPPSVGAAICGAGLRIGLVRPKVSISLLGHEGAGLRGGHAQLAAAARCTPLCSTKRSARRAGSLGSAEGDRADPQRAGVKLLVDQLGVEWDLADAVVPTPLSAEHHSSSKWKCRNRCRRHMKSSVPQTDPGLLVLSDDPVGSHPSAKTSTWFGSPPCRTRCDTSTSPPKPSGSSRRHTAPSSASSWRRTECNASYHWARSSGLPGYPHDGFFALHRF